MPFLARRVTVNIALRTRPLDRFVFYVREESRAASSLREGVALRRHDPAHLLEQIVSVATPAVGRDMALGVKQVQYGGDQWMTRRTVRGTSEFGIELRLHVEMSAQRRAWPHLPV
jgi:hypothetical protein